MFLAVSAGLAALAWRLAPRAGAHLLLLLAFGLAGAGLARLQAAALPLPTAPASVLLEGEVAELLALPEGPRLTLAVARWDGQPHAARVRLWGRGPLPRPVVPGQRVLVRARVRPLEPPGNPGQVDVAARLARQGVSHTGSFRAGELVALSPPAPWRTRMAALHQALGARVRTLAPSPASAALFLTLAAGQRAELGEALEETFSASGLAHVLSVSGLHVAALALVLLHALRRLLVWAPVLGRTRDARRLAAPLALPCVWAYVVFTGWQPPAVRSAVMASAVLVGLSLWRRADGLNALALAALVLLALEPACIADLSMQLSFLAVLSLILLTPALRGALPIGPPALAEAGPLRARLLRARETALQTLCASVAVTLAGAPLIAATFGRVSLAGLLSNILCMPLCGLLTLLAAGSAAVFVLSPWAATPLLWAGAWASELLLWVAHRFAALPLATLPAPPLSPWATALFALGLAAFALARGRARVLAALAPAALLWTLLAPRLLPAPGLTVTFLSVGQGDAIVLSSGGEHALVDGGGVPGGADTGERYVLPFLRAQHISRLKLAVLSHPHPDHALGLLSTLRQVPADTLWLAAGTAEGPLSREVREAAAGAKVEEVESGHPSFRLGEAVVEVLGPPRDRLLLEGVNDTSVVLRVRHGEVRVLLSGDVESAGEEALLPTGPITVLKAPHHGSRTSSGEALLAHTRPQAVVISAGRHNRFGFPHAEVLARYAAHGVEVYRTDLQGAVRMQSDGRSARLETWLAAGGPDAPLAPTAGHPQRAGQ